MKELLRIVNELQSHSGKKDKENIIKNNLDNKLFVEMMKFLLNDYITTGISGKKIKKDLDLYQVSPLKTIQETMNYLIKNNTGRDRDIEMVKSFLTSSELENLTSDDVKIIESIFTKSLKLGVSAKTWNKICNKEDKIPVFEVMLAKKFDDHAHKIKGNFTITKKLDGTRIIVIKDDENVKAFSRTGKEYEGLNEILNGVKNINLDNFVLDGELLAVVDENMSVQEQFAETLKRSRTKDKNKTGLDFHVFDMMPLNEFQNGKSSENHINRKSILDSLFVSNEFKHLKLVESLYQGNDFSQITEWSAKATDLEWEGIMVSLDKPYVCKRTDSLLKVKQMHTMDLKIIDIAEGDGKYEEMMGKVIVKYKGNCVGVGSGWSDELRQDMFDNQEKYIGRIIEVQYFEVSKDSKTGIESLRFPVFKRFRDDKTEESYD